MKRTMFFLYCLAVAGLFYTCQPEDPMVRNDQSAIKVQKGYLHFRDWEVFNQTLNMTRELDHNATLNWLSNFKGYESLFEFHDKIMEAETDFGAYLDQLDEDELQVYLDKFEAEKQVHSSFVDANKDYLLFWGENDFEIKYRIPQDHYPFVNKEGLMKVGENLIKFTDKYQYTILDGADSKLALLGNLTARSKELGIEVIELKKVEIPVDAIYDLNSGEARLRNCPKIGPWLLNVSLGSNDLLGCGKNGSFRVRGFIALNYIGTGSCDGTGKNKKTMSLRVQNQKWFGANRIGFWVANKTYQLSITVWGLAVTAPNFPDGHFTPTFAGLNWPGVPAPLPTPVTVNNPTFITEKQWTVWETNCNYTDFGFDLTGVTFGIGATFRAQNFTEFDTSAAPCNCF
ncbi:hypothetical protein QQ008_24605 [Fulvivirgaceae bacterium BMA10]|uniref:DUF4848 domain-containing protein n=1 Tax=Splendidivirga corallicola TaxID=3051826 RepID=A0ABT8KV20_9BACT|nr:hypothetical protein [Fulvivirgaceae bacterium BMA10]